MIGTVTTLQEYLNTSYEPDREFVEPGTLVERNLGTPRHGLLQTLIAGFFLQYRKTHDLAIFTETRLSMQGGHRFRIPDVMVLHRPYKKGKVIVDVPTLVVEIKSPDDTLGEMIAKCIEYERLGVSSILVVDPDRDNLRGWLFVQGKLQLIEGGTVSLKVQGEAIDVPFGQMFEELEED